jgi:predicted metal-dependent phosphoesterase TrpH
LKKPLAYDPHAGIDLHVHSTASDGSLTPSEILAMAVQTGLGAIAITDHDTLDGSAEALRSGIPVSLQFLTGIEISADAPDGFCLNGSVHILGYGIDPDNAPLIALLRVLKTARENRNPQIIARLRALGMPLSISEVDDIVGNAIAGRPHIAQLLVKKGFADSIDDAFDRFLGKNRPAYIDKYRVPMADAIETINAAGGIAVLAHPYLNGITDPAEFEAFLQTLMPMGLSGIEAIYPEHPETIIDAYCRLADKYGLVVTGGTDFHGEVTPGIKIGVGNGDFHVPYTRFEALAARLKPSS